MAFSIWTGMTKITQTLCQTQLVNVLVENNRSIYLSACLYRARRGTRERKLKQLKKNKARKAAERIRHQLQWMQQQKKSASGTSKRINDSDRPLCTDNVYFANLSKLRIFSFKEAIKSFRETMHPTMYDDPEAPVHAYIELDMTTDRKTKFFEGFTNVIPANYPYDHKEERSILAFCKLREQMDAALDAGATLAGGQEIITGVKRGKITLPDFEFVIAHPNILHELAVIRGLLRKKYPELEKGTLSNDLPGMIKNIKKGIKYEAKQDNFEQSYGWVDVQIGTINMEIEHLEDNLKLLLLDVRTKGPPRTKDNEDYQFMTRCFLMNPVQNEKLLLNMDELIPPQEIVDSDDEDNEVVATNKR